MFKNKKNQSKKLAFTVLELLVVIVIIGILALIAFLSWRGIRDEATTSLVSTELNGASKTLSLYKAEFNTYPESNDCSASKKPLPPKTCLTFGNDVSYDYIPSADLLSYEVIASKDNITLKITDINSVPVPTTLPDIAAPSAPTATYSTVGNDTTYSWSSPTCASGNINYQYRHTTNGGYDSGFVATTNTSFSAVTVNEGFTYNTEVQARCSIASKNSDWSSSSTVSYYRPMTTPVAPTLAVAYTSPNVVATISPVTCVAGTTPQYDMRIRTNDGTWGAYSSWGTTMVFSQAATQGIKYGFQAQARCHSAVSDSSYATSTESTYVHPLTSLPTSGPIVTSSTTGSTTTFNWSAAVCPFGTASYQYRYTVSSGYDSGWVSTAALSISQDTSIESLTYTLSVQAKCATSYSSGPWTASNATSYTRPTSVTYYTLTNSAGTGGTVSSGGTYASGTSVTITAAPNSGYTFSSWSGSAGCSGTASHSVTVNSNMSCTATFAASAVYYSLTATAGTGGSASGSVGSVLAGTSRTITATPNSGYSFSSWSGTGCSGTASHNVTVNSNMTCTANFTLDPPPTVYYTLTNSAGTGGTVSSGGTYVSGTSVTITAAANSGYTFSSWSGSTGCSGIASHSITMDSNKTCTANFTVNAPSYYSLTVSAGTGGTASGSVASVVAGTSRTITATPNSNYAFSSWSGTGCSGTASHNVTVNSNMTCTANFVPTYVMMVNAGTGGTVSMTVLGSTSSSGIGGIPGGTSASITATPSSGYSFSSWSGTTGCSGAATHSLTVNSSVNCTATFVANPPPVTYYTLTNSAGTGGTVSSGGTYASGTGVTITASANSGYTFSSWSGSAGCSGAYSHTITMDSNKTCTANFTASSVYYSLTVNYGTGGTASGSVGSVLAGSSQTITATPSSGYNFSSWTGAACSGTASHNVTVNSNMTCTANFTAKPSKVATKTVGPQASSTFAATYAYNEGGYSGTLNRTNVATNAGPSCSVTFTYKYVCGQNDGAIPGSSPMNSYVWRDSSSMDLKRPDCEGYTGKVTFVRWNTSMIYVRDWGGPGLHQYYSLWSGTVYGASTYTATYSGTVYGN